MKLNFFQTRQFSKSLDNFVKRRLLLRKDFDDFLRILAENPDIGDVIAGTNGVRKTRLRSASRGKSGGFRVCYYLITQVGTIYLLLIYAKNEQENLTMEEKQALRELTRTLRGQQL
jgi:hypothetical protein